MSSSSTRERRGQTSPLAALAAVFAVCAGVSVYATALGGVLPADAPRDVADATLSRTYAAVSDGGVTTPSDLDAATDVAPEGYRTAVTLVADDERWTVGPTPPPSDRVDVATRVVGVRLGPGRVVRGRLRVAVWR
jgi:hypothetical protein